MCMIWGDRRFLLSTTDPLCTHRSPRSHKKAPPVQLLAGELYRVQRANSCAKHRSQPESQVLRPLTCDSDKWAPCSRRRLQLLPTHSPRILLSRCRLDSATRSHAALLPDKYICTHSRHKRLFPHLVSCCCKKAPQSRPSLE